MLSGVVAAALMTVSAGAIAAPTNPAAKSSGNGAGVPTATLINIGILAAIVAMVLVATGDDDDNSDSN